MSDTTEKTAILRSQKQRDFLLDLLYDIVGSILFSIGIYSFAKNADFAPGGISGLSLIIHHLWGLPIGTVSLCLNLPLILLSYRVVGRRFMTKSIRSILISTFFLDVIFPHTPSYSGSQLLASLFSGVFFGAGLAMFYVRGSSTGGTDFLTMTIKKLKPHLSIGLVTMSIDLVIILLGWPVFGNVDSVLYGLIATFVTSAVIDKIMYGVDSGKLAIIITTRSADVAAGISDACERGSTAIRAKGTYTGLDREVLLCACSKAEAYKVRNAAQEADPDAFVMITETSEVFGEGFIDPRDNVKIG
ncbi:MAG: YitT family protein [Lachnospiraceae bacterium]|nr:YitT family protein [Lachnospiraceae bacterium]